MKIISDNSLSNRFVIAALVVAVTSIPVTASATNGNQPVANGQSARGVAGAGIAYPQDTLGLSINPASGVLIGNRIDAGIEFFQPDRDMTLGGQTFDGNETDLFPIPEFGYNRLIGDNKSFGISISAAGGQNTDYAFHPLLGGPAGIDLAQLFIQPTYSIKVDKNSFGISLNIAYQEFEAKGLGALSAASMDPAKFTDNGVSDATGVGITLGWIGQVSDTVTLGATYQSEISMDEFDEYVGLFPGGSVDIPEKFGIGLAYKASDAMDILLDITRVNYSKISAFGNPTTGDGRSPLGAETGPGFGWDDITIYRLGVVYRVNPTFILRAGYNHGDQPVPNGTFNDAFFNSLVPGVTTDHLSIGFTHQFSETFSITGSYVRTFDETLEGNGAKLTPPGAGTPAPDLRMDQNAIGITFSWLR